MSKTSTILIILLFIMGFFMSSFFEIQASSIGIKQQSVEIKSNHN